MAIRFFFLTGFLLFFLPVAVAPATPAVRLPLTRLGTGGAAATAVAAAFSLRRARHLKHRPHFPSPSLTPLSSHSYGGYSLSLSFGTPPQRIPLILDTGSDLVWVPCTSSYLCSHCTGGAAVFLPRSSSSVKLVGCQNPKCGWIHAPELLSQCALCPNNETQISCSPACPPYTIIYASGSTGGVLLSETLKLAAGDTPAITNFAVGCSVFSSRQPPAGVAGFGRGPASLPSQLNLSSFSYCLLSRRYDGSATVHGSAALGGAPASSGFSFTPFLRNPSPDSPFSLYYYIRLKKITVDGQRVKVPKAALFSLPNGNGGTIIDSGTTFTFMESRVFNPLARAMEEKIAGRYNRSSEAERSTGLRLCFSVKESERLILPELAFHFKGGAVMKLPAENYFALQGKGFFTAACLTIVTEDGGGGGGPAVILGNFQQQDYQVIFDLDNERLGFRRQSCAVDF